MSNTKEHDTKLVFPVTYITILILTSTRPTNLRVSGHYLQHSLNPDEINTNAIQKRAVGKVRKLITKDAAAHGHSIQAKTEIQNQGS